LAEEFIATAQKIYGGFKGVYAVSNDDKSPQTLASDVDAIIDLGGPDDSFVILVDFLGGSCGHATLSVERRRRNVRVVSGVNLPMLLAFLNKRADISFERLPAELVSRGRDSIHAVDTDQL
jgi:fructoselysine and glucoselysine-specific PTS system IIA component